MGLLSWLRGDDVLPGDETRALPPPENELPLYAGYLGSPISATDALAIADCWAATRVLCDAASSLPLHVYRRRDDGGRERVTSGRLVELLDRPGPATTQADLISTLMAHLVIHGAGYVGKFRQQGEVTQLGPLHPERVRPELDGGRLRFRYSPGTTAQQMLSEADLVYVRGLSVDGLHGLSVVQQAADVLGLSRELIKHALSYFQVVDAGGVPRPAGVLSITRPIDATGRARELEGLRAESRSHGILVIEGEDAKYLDIAGDLDSAQFVEQRRLVAQEIARVFRIPPHMLGAPTSDSMTYSTTEQQSLDFVKYSLQPWLRRIELAISNDPDLCFQRQYVRFEVDGLLRADAKTRAEVYALALDPVQGWMTREEVRRLEDLPPEPPLQQTTIEQMLAQGVANGRQREPSA
jgi:HK97 family phage portal protein